MQRGNGHEAPLIGKELERAHKVGWVGKEGASGRSGRRSKYN